MLGLSGPSAGALLTAVLITVLELTEVVAIVYALGAGAKNMRPGLTGAIAGVGVVGAIALVIGFGITQASSRGGETYTLIAGALILWFFAFFLLRSTFKTYLKEDRKKRGVAPGGPAHHDEGLSPKALFATAFSVGTVETIEAVVVLVGLVAVGHVWEALVGAIIGGIILVTMGLLLHERIRRMKVPPLKWIATSLLFTFAVFWSLESLGDLGVITWPSTIGGVVSDIVLIPFFLVSFLAVRAAILVRLQMDRGRTAPNTPPSSH